MTQPRHKKPLTHCEKYGHSWSTATTATGWKKCTREACQAALPPAPLQLAPSSLPSATPSRTPTVEQVSLFE